MFQIEFKDCGIIGIAILRWPHAIPSLSSRRMFPHSSSQTLLYSPIVESFGVGIIAPTIPKKMPSAAKTDASSKKKASEKSSTPKKLMPKLTKMSLTDLPLEILEKIFVQLDSFRWITLFGQQKSSENNLKICRRNRYFYVSTILDFINLPTLPTLATRKMHFEIFFLRTCS